MNQIIFINISHNKNKPLAMSSVVTEQMNWHAQDSSLFKGLKGDKTSEKNPISSRCGGNAAVFFKGYPAQPYRFVKRLVAWRIAQQP